MGMNSPRKERSRGVRFADDASGNETLSACADGHDRIVRPGFSSWPRTGMTCPEVVVAAGAAAGAALCHGDCWKCGCHDGLMFFSGADLVGVVVERAWQEGRM